MTRSIFVALLFLDLIAVCVLDGLFARTHPNLIGILYALFIGAQILILREKEKEK